MSQIGELLKLLLPKMLECKPSALSRLVSNLASRKIELLLTMSMGEVTEQLPRDELISLMDSLIESKLVKKQVPIHFPHISLITNLYIPQT